MRVVRLMNSPAGRATRAAAGLVIAAGALAGGTGGLGLALIGLIPLAGRGRGVPGRAAAAGPVPGPLSPGRQR